MTEPEVLAGDDDVRADAAQNALGELLRLLLLEVVRELEHEHLFVPAFSGRNEPAVQCGEELDAVAQDESRMRIEGDRGCDEAGIDRGLEHRLVSQMNAVEDADRNRPLTSVEL